MENANSNEYRSAIVTNVTLAQKAKAEKSLNIQMRYSEGVMTKKAWIELQLKKGSTVEQGTKNRIQFNRIKYNRMGGGIWSNEQDEYEKKCNEIVVSYKIYEAGKTSFYEITKTEYDYFNSLKS